MATAIPSIACLGVIGRNNNPLHITIFPSHGANSQHQQLSQQQQQQQQQRQQQHHQAAVGAPAPLRTPLQFSLLLSSTLDVFEARARQAAAAGPGTMLSGDYGLLHAVDDRLAAYGFETNTGVKFVAVVDMRGRPGRSASFAAAASGPQGGGGGGGGPGAPGAAGGGGAGAAVLGLRDVELKPVFRAMQAAYVRLLQNPFYDPDEHAPLGGRGGKKITSRRFSEDMRRIGERWAPGVTAL